MEKTQSLYHYKDTLLLLIILSLAFIILTSFDHKGENLLKSSLNTRSKCSKRTDEECDIFSGKWVPFPEGPYYTDKTQCVMDPRQNCMKKGRLDTEFMKWRWQPDDCDLDLFDGVKFLELVRGKSMAFVGDSMARNQIQSLGCLLSNVIQYTNKTDTYGGALYSWYYPDYNFSLVYFYSVHLLKSDAPDASYLASAKLYLDEVDMTWLSHMEKFDYVIISSGHWFTKPLLYYKKGNIFGCHLCKHENVTKLNNYYGYKFALETAFKEIVGLNRFKGKVFLRTISPSHFELDYTKGFGDCPEKRPTKEEENTGYDWLIGSYYMHQMEEFRVAKNEGKRRGLEFELLDVTDAMALRADGHPGNYGGHGKFPDCLHWCLPGPVDTWNEFLLHKLKMEKHLVK